MDPVKSSRAWLLRWREYTTFPHFHMRSHNNATPYGPNSELHLAKEKRRVSVGTPTTTSRHATFREKITELLVVRELELEEASQSSLALQAVTIGVLFRRSRHAGLG